MFCVIRESKLALCVLLQHPYLYLLHYIIVHSHAHEQIHHCFFFGEKSALDTGSFENGNSVETKKGVHDFMCATSLMCKKQYINITEELNSKQRNQNSDIYFTENIPKTSKNAADVLECEFLLIAPL